MGLCLDTPKVHAETSRVGRTQIRPVQFFKSDLLVECDVGPNEVPLFDKLSVNFAKSGLDLGALRPALSVDEKRGRATLIVSTPPVNEPRAFPEEKHPAGPVSVRGELRVDRGSVRQQPTPEFIQIQPSRVALGGDLALLRAHGVLECRAGFGLDAFPQKFEAIGAF